MPLSAALRALRFYAPAASRRWPPTRFVIVTVGRSGSQLLSDLLGSHPEIVCDGEILAADPAWPRLCVAARTAEAARHGAEVYGWKLLIGHLGDPVESSGPARFVSALARRGTRFILLEREDHLQQSISWYRAHATRYHHHRGEEGEFAPQEIDPDLLLRATAVNAEATAWLRQAVSPFPHLRLIYEHDLFDPVDRRRTLDQVCRFIGVEPAPMSSDLVRVSPRRTREMVTNWPAIAAAFELSAFARFVAEEPIGATDGPGSPTEGSTVGPSRATEVPAGAIVPAGPMPV